jgi:hypothetical protein
MEKGKGFTQTELAQFTGTENWYRHSIARNVHYTDGVLFVAERAGAYWLIDEIVLAQWGEAVLAGEEFQVWELIVEGSAAILRCEDGNGGRLLEKRIGYTDFPEPGIKLYCTDGVIMLPGEY